MRNLLTLTIVLLSLGICSLTQPVLAAPRVGSATRRPSLSQKTNTKPQVPKASVTTESGRPSKTVHDAKNSKDAASPGIWPCFDALDKKLIMISIPMIINFSITPLVGANDLFWTNRMGNALAVAGMAASNQVYQTGFFLASFLPSVTSTIVGKENAKKNQEGVQDAVCQALFVATLIAIAGTGLFLIYPEQTLASVLEHNAPAYEYAKPYLAIRGLCFLPGLISLVGFSAFRGTLDVKTPFTISLFSNLINCVLDPILIFTFKMGVTGNAMSTLLAEIVSAVTFVILLSKRNLIQLSKIFRFPAWSVLGPLIKGGFALQLRLLALNVAFLSVVRVTQSIDKTGVAAAAHEMALQTFQLGGVVLIALSVVAQIVLPNELYSKGGARAARTMSNRMMSWGFILGTLLGGFQIAVLPWIKLATPMQDVRNAAHSPAIIASLLQIINGLVFIGEGVMSGCGDFMFLAISTLIAMGGCLGALAIFPQQYGVTGVWMGFVVFNILRLMGVIIHQFFTSQIAPRNIEDSSN